MGRYFVAYSDYVGPTRVVQPGVGPVCRFKRSFTPLLAEDHAPVLCKDAAAGKAFEDAPRSELPAGEIEAPQFKGHAYNLRQASDIVGTYTAVSVSAAVVGGAKVARLLNSDDMVYLQLEGPQVGLELSTAVSRMTISPGRH
jgi:hypothetical protein